MRLLDRILPTRWKPNSSPQPTIQNQPKKPLTDPPKINVTPTNKTKTQENFEWKNQVIKTGLTAAGVLTTLGGGYLAYQYYGTKSIPPITSLPAIVSNESPALKVVLGGAFLGIAILIYLFTTKKSVNGSQKNLPNIPSTLSLPPSSNPPINSSSTASTTSDQFFTDQDHFTADINSKKNYENKNEEGRKECELLESTNDKNKFREIFEKKLKDEDLEKILHKDIIDTTFEEIINQDNYGWIINNCIFNFKQTYKKFKELFYKRNIDQKVLDKLLNILPGLIRDNNEYKDDVIIVVVWQENEYKNEKQEISHVFQEEQENGLVNSGNEGTIEGWGDRSAVYVPNDNAYPANVDEEPPTSSWKIVTGVVNNVVPKNLIENFSFPFGK